MYWITTRVSCRTTEWLWVAKSKLGKNLLQVGVTGLEPVTSTMSKYPFGRAFQLIYPRKHGHFSRKQGLVKRIRRYAVFAGF
jgi:hypothetical protein